MSKTEILNCYKATLILDTQGYKESIEELISNTKNTFTELGGIINDFKDLGYKDFMRIKNRKFCNGCYIQITFTGSKKMPSIINEKFRLNRIVNRIFIESQDF